MNKKSKITVIILTHDSYSTKCGSIEFVITSYLNQKNSDCIEIIVINNSSNKDDTKKLKLFAKKYPELKIIDCDMTVGGARNLGAREATSDILLFTEDDTIPLQDNIPEIILSIFSSNSTYAYGANRKWSKDLSWVNDNRQTIINSLIEKKYSYLKDNLIVPDPAIRNKNEKSQKVLLKSFIGNFGIIHKKMFEEIGGFPLYPGYACEDDAFAFLCFLALGRPVILNSVELMHLSHPITEIKEAEYQRNRLRYAELLNSKGYSAFHITRLLFPNSNNSPILERILRT